MKKKVLEAKIAALAAWAIEQTEAKYGKDASKLPKRQLDTMPKFMQLVDVLTKGQSRLSMDDLRAKEAEVNIWLPEGKVWEAYEKHGPKLGHLYVLLAYFEGIGKPRTHAREHVFSLRSAVTESYA